MPYTGGPYQSDPAVYVVYWGWDSDPAGEQVYLNNFLSSIGGTSWTNTMRQYGVIASANLFKGTWSDGTSLAAAPTETQVEAEAVRAAQHFGLADSINTQIVVATPTGKSMVGFPDQYCGFHYYTSGSGYSTLPYTYLPYVADSPDCFQNTVNSGSAGALDGVGIVEGHELAETATDPLLSAWHGTFKNTEIGDKCARDNGLQFDYTTSAGTFAVQQLWSNVAGSCVNYTSTAGVSGPPAISGTTAILAPGNGNETVSVSADLKGATGASAWVEYGLDTGYGLTTGFDALSPDQNPLTISVPVTGLLDVGAAYHYRILVATPQGVTSSPDQTFVPQGVMPYTVNDYGTGNAVIEGRIYPLGATSATASGRYGATTGYGSSTGSGDVHVYSGGVGTFSLPISGLVPQDFYHYQVTVSSTAGSQSSDDQTVEGAGPPTTTNLTAQVCGSSVVIGASVDLNGDTSATGWAEYGPTTGYGAQTTSQTVRNYYDAVKPIYPPTITGLTPGATYHYRFQLQGSTGDGYVSPDASFDVPTGSLPSEVGSPAVKAMGNGTETITGGTCMPNVSSGTVTLAYGTTTGYGTTVAQNVEPRNNGSHSVDSGYLYHLYGLTAGTVYHYQLQFTDTQGTWTSPDQTFTP